MPVIVTRPQPEAARWAARLRSAGLAAEVLPLIAILPSPDAASLREAWRRIASFRAVMFVSANAVRGFFAASEGTPFTSRAWAPGPGTSGELLEHGVDASLIDGPGAGAVQFDSEALWQVVAGQAAAGDRVLVVRGGDAAGQSAGRDWLAQRLHESGVIVDTVVAYLRQAPAWGGAERALATRAASDGSTWLFSSSEAVGNLASLLPGQRWQGARAVATHPRIAQAARAAGFGEVRECHPAFEEVLASLQSPR
ncbi:MAG: uroporphyrinogen-III synthase [Burkholderiales bacterium]|nr:uroporphyrinogen-III synthase [Burkholderiales bacterium]